MQPVESTLADLIRINSVNAFYDGGPGECAVATFIETFFRNHNIPTVRQRAIEASPTCGERFNVIAKLDGKDPSKRLILEAHMDTVSVQGMTIPPFEPTINDRKMYGRGSCDTKGGLAAMMHALASLREDRIVPPCDVWLAAVVDEEFSFRGVSALCAEHGADAAVVAEPTNLRVAIASKGVLRWRIISHGKAAHSSKTHLGKNAIYHMVRIVQAIEQQNTCLSLQSDPLLGPATVNVGRIYGGVQVNFVPDQCAVEIDRRMLPHESVEQVLSEYETIIRKLQSEHPEFKVEMEAPMLVDLPWQVSADTLLVKTAFDVLDSLALPSPPIGVPFGSDASKFGKKNIPTIIFGPGSIDQAHAEVEYVSLDEVELAYRFYRECAIRYSTPSENAIER